MVLLSAHSNRFSVSLMKYFMYAGEKSIRNFLMTVDLFKQGKSKQACFYQNNSVYQIFRIDQELM